MLPNACILKFHATDIGWQVPQTAISFMYTSTFVKCKKYQLLKHVGKT